MHSGTRAACLFLVVAVGFVAAGCHSLDEQTRRQQSSRRPGPQRPTAAAPTSPPLRITGAASADTARVPDSPASSGSPVTLAAAPAAPAEPPGPAGPQDAALPGLPQLPAQTRAVADDVKSVAPPTPLGADRPASPPALVPAPAAAPAAPLPTAAAAPSTPPPSTPPPSTPPPSTPPPANVPLFSTPPSLLPLSTTAPPLTPSPAAPAPSPPRLPTASTVAPPTVTLPAPGPSPALPGGPPPILTTAAQVPAGSSPLPAAAPNLPIPVPASLPSPALQVPSGRASDPTAPSLPINVPAGPVEGTPVSASRTASPGAPATTAAREATLTVTAPAAQISAAETGDARLRSLHREAADAFSRFDSYNARLTRREVVSGKVQAQEIILYRFRKEPWSIYMKWLDGKGRGRECSYVKGRYDDKLHILVASGDVPFTRAGSRVSFATDSMLIRSSSRHVITEAGIGNLIDSYGRLVDNQEQGDRRLGTLSHAGLQKRPEFSHPIEVVDHAIPPGAEKELPRGGRRTWVFDPASRLPVLIVTLDDKGQEVEYYLHDRLQYPVNLDEDDFCPDRLWGKR